MAEAELSFEEQAERAYQRILRSASVREQSSVRMRVKLVQAGYATNVIDHALERAQTAHVIDDRRYAESLVRTSLASGKGLRFVEREVEELGIDLSELDAYQDYLEEGEDAEVARAVSFLRLHPTHAKDKRGAAYRKLVTKGYSSSVALSAARQWCESLESDECENRWGT